MATAYERTRTLANLEARTDLTSAQAEFSRGPKTRFTDEQTKYIGERTKSLGIKNKYDEDTLELKIDVANMQYAEFIADEPGRKVMKELQIDNAQQMLDYRNKYPSSFEGAMIRAEIKDKLSLRDAEINHMALDGYNNLSGIASMFDDDPKTTHKFDAMGNKIGGDESQVTPEKLTLAGELWSEWLTNFRGTYGEMDPNTGTMQFRMPDNPDGSPGAPINFPGMPEVGEPFTAKHLPGLRWASSRFQGMSQFGQQLRIKEEGSAGAIGAAGTAYDKQMEFLKLVQGEQKIEGGETDLALGDLNLSDKNRLAFADQAQTLLPGLVIDSNGMLLPDKYEIGDQKKIAQHGAYLKIGQAVLSTYPRTTNPRDISQYMMENYQQFDSIDVNPGVMGELNPFGGNDDVFAILPRDETKRAKLIDKTEKMIEKMIDNGDVANWQEGMDLIMTQTFNNLTSAMIQNPEKYRITNPDGRSTRAFINTVGQ